MLDVGPSSKPLRVAVVGAGPAGFYAAEHLCKRPGLSVEVDILERLPTPFGLVRFGVAPDHQKIKSATKAFDRVASRPNVRFFGNVEFGAHVRLDDLRRHYHLVCFATGAQTDRSMGIPGEDLLRSHPATEFVAWYNGHPDFRNHEFDLSVERVAVVGVGNVAVDVARILCRTPEELATTDIADYALEALRASRVREVYLLGRRGPAQAAFTNPEIKELGDLEGAALVLEAAEVELDPLSREQVAAHDDRATHKKLEILQELAAREPVEKPRTLRLRFLVSPVELVGDDAGRVVGMRVVRNQIFRSDDGTLRPRATDHVDHLPVQMVFRSVGYRGVTLPDLPFDERRGVIPNERGRVVLPDSGRPLAGVYVSGWIKRGPSGVIGTNKPDAGETVDCMVEDAARGVTLQPSDPDPDAVEALLRERQPAVVVYQDWQRLDQVELERGASQGRPRVKLTSVAEMLGVLERA
jgi:ferredoxin--NADP+ reductase